MPTKKFVQTFVLLTMMPSAMLWLHAQSSQNVPGIALDQLELHNVKAEAANYSGKPAVRVDALPDAANGFVLVVSGVRHSGVPVRIVLGDQWHSMRQVLRDIGIAAAFWIVSAGILFVLGWLLRVAALGRKMDFILPLGAPK